ncbi:MAG: phosphoribosylaminoimidazolesuccinocarboxamide synthase [Vagococcus sp.]|uniref:phosphoribosylaminoimidazolesuccinocarboxamide synthase n=1 Tax=Vagococcus sp. TaxID=1933889 RepID=UPI002FCA974A
METTLIYEGKAKNVYSSDEPNVLRLEYLDQATALNGKKKDVVKGKGELNNQITSLIFSELSKQSISNHWIKILSKNEQLVKKVKIIPLEVVLRNVAAGSFTRRLGVKEGTILEHPIIEFYYKDDLLDDPFINDEHIAYLSLASKDELAYIKSETLKINNALIKIFDDIDVTLVDFKLEFGKDANGAIILSDEVTPDTCRLWDKSTRTSLDKDIYRKDLGNIIPIYQEILSRLKNKGEDKDV